MASSLAQYIEYSSILKEELCFFCSLWLQKSKFIFLNHMHSWSKTKSSGFDDQIQNVWKALHCVQSYDEELHLQQLLQDLLAKQEKYWWQRSQVSWFKWGDRNTSYFHGRATTRHQRNLIKGLWKDHIFLRVVKRKKKQNGRLTQTT